jgi:hypothetical protein
MIDYVEIYGSLRFRADRRADAIGQAVVHAALCGLDVEPTTARLDLFGWTGPEDAALVFAVDKDLFRAAVIDPEGETVYSAETSVGNIDGICEMSETAVDSYLPWVVDLADPDDE